MTIFRFEPRSLLAKAERFAFCWAYLGGVGGVVWGAIEWRIFHDPAYRSPDVARAQEIVEKGVHFWVSEPVDIAWNVSQFMFFSGIGSLLVWRFIAKPFLSELWSNDEGNLK